MGRGVRELERAGVGEYRDVEVCGDFGRDSDPELVDQFEDDLADCRGLVIHVVEVAERKGIPMVVDVDDEVLVEPRQAGASQFVGLEHKDGVVLTSESLVAPDVVDAGEAGISLRVGIGVDDFDLFAQLLQSRWREQVPSPGNRRPGGRVT